MELINKQYIVDENNRKVAVQIPIDVFEKMELLLEDHALFHLMKENTDSDLLELTDAQAYYRQLVKEA
ncbi:MAG: hypothetical protein HOG03_19710 [Desulfobacula sp.]|jgi:hypothetical protein|uniref:hypothetical protein n=1 Tax=Desulfobacula sp. TaxID=2593537 RepID=UPI001D719B2E|nr:hypothetical protein [Desulfobacula sp.]MBT3486466.1 hypothetical protein [Desulfobacula sp.]MBT3806797.1 hypothetical protein [Desulfobacula sp.]MBT4027092.1 hypothetical protein [Desulfobacula sp.]MBT4197892.1 hypothetical protein [Desulfobacula sp.]